MRELVEMIRTGRSALLELATDRPIEFQFEMRMLPPFLLFPLIHQPIELRAAILKLVCSDWRAKDAPLDLMRVCQDFERIIAPEIYRTITFLTCLEGGRNSLGHRELRLLQSLAGDGKRNTELVTSFNYTVAEFGPMDSRWHNQSTTRDLLTRATVKMSVLQDYYLRDSTYVSG